MNHLLLPSNLAWLDKSLVVDAIKQLDSDANIIFASNKIEETIEAIDELDDGQVRVWVIPAPQTPLVFSSCMVGRGIYDTLEELDTVYGFDVNVSVLLPNGVFGVETATIVNPGDYKKYGRLHLQEVSCSDKFALDVHRQATQKTVVSSSTSPSRRKLLLAV